MDDVEEFLDRAGTEGFPRVLQFLNSLEREFEEYNKTKDFFEMGIIWTTPCAIIYEMMSVLTKLEVDMDYILEQYQNSPEFLQLYRIQLELIREQEKLDEIVDQWIDSSSEDSNDSGVLFRY
ncbi:unnamed protein product [Cyprideis torosa]|uniref:Uncharacterized protein n=1 Tax=Cyprideis torosa TaxID=163714 RepID=A0A7R8ZNU4_9CRUS|nr:unnamed protein product [Cyprideis torosa]CAG0898845.1 unnamed protein product [Cyprideis torosa]